MRTDLINIDIITSCKLYDMSSSDRKDRIYSYFNKKLESQNLEDIDVLNINDSKVDMNNVIDQQESEESIEDELEDLNDELDEKLSRSEVIDNIPEDEEPDLLDDEPKDKIRPTQHPSHIDSINTPTAVPDDLPKKVENSVSSSIIASLPRTDVMDNMELEVLDIKELLDVNESTSGINRVEVKNKSELWIYYNDTIDTSNIMIDVIDLLNRSGYTYLEFNRLARSNNAIVFSINKEDTDYRKKFKSELDAVEDIKKEEV